MNILHLLLIIGFTIILLDLSILIIEPIIRKHRILVIRSDFETQMTILNTLIRSEIDLYEKDIFTNREGITNSNFDNFYNDLVHRIIDNMSPIFFKQLQTTLTEEAIVTYIARSIKIYLETKVTGV